MNASAVGQLKHELSHLKRGWWWFLILGVLLVAGGTLAICYPFVSSIGVVIMLGAILVVCGIATVVGAFWAGKWSAFFLQILVGILYVVVGLAITDAPVQSSAVITLLIASFFIVVGVFRIIVSLVEKFPQWGWALLNGVITLLAGLLIYRYFPETGLWVVGLLVGLEMLFNGWTWIMMSFAIRNLPAED